MRIADEESSRHRRPSAVDLGNIIWRFVPLPRKEPNGKSFYLFFVAILAIGGRNGAEETVIFIVGSGREE